MEEIGKVERVREYIDQNTTEIPCLTLRRSRGYNDFKMEEICLESKAYTIGEAIIGLDKLIRELKSMEK